LALGACRLEFEDEPLASSPEAVAAVHGYFFGLPRGSGASSLLDGYREQGEAYLRQVDGEFAFVLWDRRTRTLYLCRDSFGTKPLFFARDGQRLAAASEIRQVLRSGVVAASANRSRLAADLGAGRSAPEETHFSGVLRVLRSQLLRFSPALEREGMVTWAPPTTVDRRRSEEDVLDELPRLLSRSIARRRWRRPMVTLSSGLDSAAIAGVVSSDDALREEFSAGGQPRAITLSYAGWDCDETEEAGRLARRLSIAQVVVDATGTGPVEWAEELGLACDQPYGATGYEIPLLLREARRLGHESVATGIGAEYSWETTDLLAADLLRLGDWARLFREARDRVGPGAGKLAGFFWRDAVRPWIGEGARRLRLRGSRHASAWESMMWRSKDGQINSFPNSLQIEFIEQIGVHEGVEMIHPFLDREMAAFAFSTPPRFLGTLTNRKRLMARAMARRIPDALWERPKVPGPDLFVERSLRGVPGWLGPASLWRLPAILPLDPEKQELLRRVSVGEPLEFPALAWDMVCREFWLRRHFPEEASRDEGRDLAAIA
jgi:asparagine synthase (glutamine-hydrolysing)